MIASAAVFLSESRHREKLESDKAADTLQNRPIVRVFPASYSLKREIAKPERITLPI